MTTKPEVLLDKLHYFCQYPGCAKISAQFAYNREINKLDTFCQEHATEVAIVGDPEYIVDCPGCGCRFGVN